MARRNLLWIAVVAGITLLFYRLAPMAADPEPVQRAYAPLVEVDALIRRSYVEPIGDDRLVEGAIRGMMRKLDPYSGYIAPEEMESFRRKTGGEFIGIGVEIGMHRGQITVIAPIEDGPAVKAGIRPGDVLLAVDGASTEDLTVFDVNERLRGPAGTDVSLNVRHRGQEETETIAVTHGPVNVHGVKGFRLAGPGRWDFVLDPKLSLAYVRVASFQSHTLEKFDQALGALREGGATGLVLDLRFNPGGLMPPAIDLVDRFISEGVIVSTVSRRSTPRSRAPGSVLDGSEVRESDVEVYPAHAEDSFAEIPLVVLINGSTASAAEIVAGSLQAHGRAVVVGSRSFGKGSVQHVIEVSGAGSAIRLTVAYYRLPNGRVIHRTPANAATDEWGVVPDVELVLSEEEIEAIQESRREVDGFTDFSDEAAIREAAATSAPMTPMSPGILIDRQLALAIEILAGSGETP